MCMYVYMYMCIYIYIYIYIHKERERERERDIISEAGRLPTAAIINPPRPGAYELPSEAYGMEKKRLSCTQCICTCVYIYIYIYT